MVVSVEVMISSRMQIDRRIGDLREELLEIIVKQLRLVREHRERRVGAHRAERLRTPSRAIGADDECAGLRRCNRTPAGVAGRFRGRARAWCAGSGRSFESKHDVHRAIARYGCSVAIFALDLFVGDDAALLGVDQEHAARLQAAFVQRRARAAMSSTPTSDAMMTRSSLVT